MLTGIMIASVEEDQRNTANSLAQFCQNLFGYFPAPIVYGIVIENTGGSLSNYGMVILAFS